MVTSTTLSEREKAVKMWPSRVGRGRSGSCIEGRGTQSCDCHVTLSISPSLSLSSSHLGPVAMVHVQNPRVSQLPVVLVEPSTHQDLRVQLSIVDAAGSVSFAALRPRPVLRYLGPQLRVVVDVGARLE